jgi:hypothetical protein
VNPKKSNTLTVEQADRILQNQLIYRYDWEWNIAIYAHYRFAIEENTLADHARTHNLSVRDYESCIQALQIKNLLKTLADFSRSSNRIPPIVDLHVNDRFSCSLYSFLTRSKSLIKEHRIKHPGIKDYRREVKLQVSIKLCSLLICRCRAEVQHGLDQLIHCIRLSLYYRLLLLLLYHLLHLPSENNYRIKSRNVLLGKSQRYFSFTIAIRRTIRLYS